MNPIPTAKPRGWKTDSTGLSSSLGRALFQQRIEAVLLHTKEAAQADGIAVSLQEGDEYICRVSVGCAPEIGVSVKSGQGVCGRCIAQAAIVVEGSLDGDIKSVAAIPVMKNGNVFGFVAGFSLDPNAFPGTALEEFQHLATRIQIEIDPPIVELTPEDDDESVMSKFGLDVSATKPETESPPEEDDAYLTELVREVLEPAPRGQDGPELIAPSSEAPNEPETPLPDAEFPSAEDVMQQFLEQPVSEDQQPSPLIADVQASPEPPPVDSVSEPPSAQESSAAEIIHEVTPVEMREAPPTSGGDMGTAAAPARAPERPTNLRKRPRIRTTEEVLMEVVDHTPRLPHKKPQHWETSQAPQKIEKGQVEAAEEQHEPKSPLSHTPALTETPTDSKSDQYKKRVVVASAAAVLVLATASTALVYFYKSHPAQPQQVTAPVQQQQTTTPTTAPPQPAEPPTQQTNKTPTQAKPTQPERKATETPRPQIVVSTNDLPARPKVDDAAPVELTGVAGKQTAPVLPTRQPTVTFGGRQSTGTIPPKLIRRIDPVFPALAKTMHLSGDVQMDALVGAEGKVISISNVKGPNVLAAAAIDAVMKWRYEPASQDGKSVESIVQVTVRFR